MDDDLIERLRETKPRYDQNTGKHTHDVFCNSDGLEAATRIESLEAQLRVMKEALEPFVALADTRDAKYRKRGGDPDTFPDTHPAYDIAAEELRIGVWRKARTALTGSDKPGKRWG